MASFKDISSLSVSRLNDLCRQHDMHLKECGKKAKINLLCSKLGISTTGGKENMPPTPYIQGHNFSQIEEKQFSLFTPGYLASLADWTTDLGQIPEIEDYTVKQYLCKSKVISNKDLRCYKLSRPFQLKQFVHSMRLNIKPIPNSSTFFVVRAQCNPSQSTMQEEVKLIFVIIDSVTGQPYGGYCTCTVGYCQACGHMGATLFCVADLLASGATKLPDDPACTELLCTWTDPKGSNVKPQLLSDIQIGQQRSLPDSKKGKKPSVKEYRQNILGPKSVAKPTFEQVSKLRNDLLVATQDLGIQLPAVHVLTQKNFGDERVINLLPVVETVETLPDYSFYDDPRILPVHEETVETKSTPVAFMSVQKNETIDSFIGKICLSESERLHVEKLTQGQWENKEWHSQRMGSITGTVIYDVNKIYDRKSRISLNRIISTVMGHKRFQSTKLPNKPCLKWGIINESKAISVYTDIMKSRHRNFRIEKKGLLVHPECGFIRASPDGLGFCDCHGPRLIEVKCPYSARDSTITLAVANKKINYLSLNGNQLSLKKTDRYYAQIQTGMAVASVQTADLVIYTKCETGIFPVIFDKIYWAGMFENAKQFFKDHIAPVIMKTKSNDDDIEIDDEEVDLEVDEDEEENNVYM